MTDALAAIVRNRSADFPWAFTTLFLLFVTAMTAVLARDGVPRDHPPVLVTGTLTVFWFGGLGFAAFASARQCLVVRVLPHANVSIVREVGFPRELTRVKRRTVALTMQPRMLADIRRRRLELAGVGESNYSSLQDVIREVMWAEKAYRERGYPIIDTTARTIEEITAEICRVLQLRRTPFDV